MSNFVSNKRLLEVNDRGSLSFCNELVPIDCIKSEHFDDETSNHSYAGIDIDEIDLKKELEGFFAVVTLDQKSDEIQTGCDKLGIKNYSITPVSNEPRQKDKLATEHEHGMMSCDHCQYESNLYHQMEKHMKNHFPDNTPFRRLECPFSSHKKYRLRRHVISLHSEEHPFACDLCTFKCKCSWSLKRHKALTHEGDESKNKKYKQIQDFVCPKCGKVISSACNVKPHLRTHEKGDFYFCAECPFSCRCPKTLKRHGAGAHGTGRGGERAPPRHACERCSYSTTQRHHLRRHRATHSRNFPARPRRLCPGCGDYFTPKTWADHQTLGC